jgi:hypothetical protein
MLARWVDFRTFQDNKITEIYSRTGFEQNLFKNLIPLLPIKIRSWSVTEFDIFPA